MNHSTSKRLPPYGKELQDRLRRADVIPEFHVWLYTGPYAWDLSRHDSHRPYYWIGVQDEGCQHAWHSPELDEAEKRCEGLAPIIAARLGIPLAELESLRDSTRSDHYRPRIDPNDLPSILIHPPGEDPWAFRWPVRRCQVIIRSEGPVDDKERQQLCKALLWHEAASVSIGRETYKKGGIETCSMTPTAAE